MGLVKVVQPIEEAKVEVFWILLIPKTAPKTFKTLIKIYKDFNAGCTYVEELKKAAKDRFQQYVLPVTLYLICFVLQALITDRLIGSGAEESNAVG